MQTSGQYGSRAESFGGLWRLQVVPCMTAETRLPLHANIRLSILLQAAGSRAGRLGPAGTTRGPGRTVRLPKVRTALRPNFRMYSHRRLRSAAGRAPMKSPSGLAGPFLVTHHGSEEQISQGLVSAFSTPLLHSTAVERSAAD